MKLRPVDPQLLRATALALSIGLAGCSVSPIAPGDVHQSIAEMRPAEPMTVYTELDLGLTCLGDKLREMSLQPQLISYAGIADTTGKTGIDIMALVRAAFAKVTSRAPGLAVTSEGFGASRSEETLYLRQPARLQHLRQPDFRLTGGTVSLANAFKTIQNAASVSATAFDLSRSGTASVDLLSLSFGLKYADSGEDLPLRTFDVRVSYQVLSNATEVGLLASARMDGRPLRAGTRFGRTTATQQIPEDAVRFGVEWVVMQALAALYSVDLSTCPTHRPTPDADLPKPGERPRATLAALNGMYADMTDRDRVEWFQRALTVLGHAPGPVDGQLGPRTRAALQRAAQDHQLPPHAEPTPTLFFAIAARQAGQGRDPRRPDSWPASTPRVAVQLDQPVLGYEVEGQLRATVVVPVAGHLNCWLASAEGTVSLLPVIEGRGNFVRAQQPVQLPDANRGWPHPRVRLTSPGRHDLWCGLSRKPLEARLPAPLRPGSDNTLSLSELRQAYLKVAGDELAAEGGTQFVVRPKGKS